MSEPLPPAIQPENRDDTAPATPTGWLARLRLLWHGQAVQTRYETRLGQLSRHREDSIGRPTRQQLSTKTTAAWWNRFR